ILRGQSILLGRHARLSRLNEAVQGSPSLLQLACLKKFLRLPSKVTVRLPPQLLLKIVVALGPPLDFLLQALDLQIHRFQSLSQDLEGLVGQRVTNAPGRKQLTYFGTNRPYRGNSYCNLARPLGLEVKRLRADELLLDVLTLLWLD